MNSPGKTGFSEDRIDRMAARRAFDRAARNGGDERVLAAEIARRMKERLEYFRLDAHHILDAGCGQESAARLLTKRFPAARLTGVDASAGMLLAARRSEPLLSRARQALGFGGQRFICADIGCLPLADASFDLVWSNLALPWLPDAGRAFREFHRVLRDGGLLMFSTYGPDTLGELRAAFAEVEQRPHVHEFTDMHDLGDALLASGFADPVMDMEKLVYSYADVESMLSELRCSGQTNVDRDRRRGLLGRSVWKSMLGAYARRKQDGRIEATFEIVHGHAWKISRRSRGGASTSDAFPVQWMPSHNSARRVKSPGF